MKKKSMRKNLLVLSKTPITLTNQSTIKRNPYSKLPLSCSRTKKTKDKIFNPTFVFGPTNIKTAEFTLSDIGLNKKAYIGLPLGQDLNKKARSPLFKSTIKEYAHLLSYWKHKKLVLDNERRNNSVIQSESLNKRFPSIQLFLKVLKNETSFACPAVLNEFNVIQSPIHNYIKKRYSIDWLKLKGANYKH